MLKYRRLKASEITDTMSISIKRVLYMHEELGRMDGAGKQVHCRLSTVFWKFLNQMKEFFCSHLLPVIRLEHTISFPG